MQIILNFNSILIKNNKSSDFLKLKLKSITFVLICQNKSFFQMKYYLQKLGPNNVGKNYC